MTNIRRTAYRVAIGAFLMSVGLPVSAQTSPGADSLQPVYLTNFGHGSLDSSVDRLGIGPIKPGNSQDPGIDATWGAGNGTVILGVTRPSSFTGVVVSSGLFATPVNFGTGSVFAARATFRAPTGPHLTGNVFAVVVGARTGDEDDLFPETRVGASFQVRGATARLNVPGAIPPAGLSNIPQAVYDAIFNPEDPLPFTLELMLDRKTGAGRASLKAGDYVISHDFQSVFTANSGPVITAVGPSIGLANGAGQRATVEVMDFRILQPNDDSSSSTSNCDPAWIEFGCRTPPSQ